VAASCVALDVGSSSTSGCDDPCTAKTLFDQASQDTNYSKIASYLTTKPGGFAANGAPKATVLRHDGTLLGSVLEASYANASDGSQTATLNCIVDRVNGLTNAAYANLYQNGTLTHVLVVGVTSGQVLKEPVPEQQGSTTAFSTVSADTSESAGGLSRTISSALLLQQADQGLSCQSVCEPICAIPISVGCAPVGHYMCAGLVEFPPALVFCEATMVVVCEQPAEAVFCQDFCKNICSCDPLENCERGSGLRGCCAACEDCKNSQCQPRCPIAKPCCAPAGGTKPICARKCPPGQHRDEYTCNCTGSKIYCACDNTCWDDLSACQNDCREGLGCLGTKCGPPPKGKCGA
jgi:hypothetical protein